MRVGSFEWTFSTRVRERKCSSCSAMTSSYSTNLRRGVRKPLCTTCFLATMKLKASSPSAPSIAEFPSSKAVTRTHNFKKEEQLRLC